MNEAEKELRDALFQWSARTASPGSPIDLAIKAALSEARAEGRDVGYAGRAVVRREAFEEVLEAIGSFVLSTFGQHARIRLLKLIRALMGQPPEPV